ncbi:MAG TPA: peptidoglycan-associated lipoprotein, partial [Aestuariivirga sp.]|nr:peptidoglycan-associated lipoprotein [Aestuariivirga sp.]
MILRNLSGLKIAVALCCVLALTACSKKNTPNLEASNAGLGAGASSPGSEADFATNVGDRIYF